MNDVQAMTKIHQSIEIESTPELVFDILTDPNNITRYAGGIEGAEVLELPGGKDDLTGAKLELVTKSNNILRATVVESTRPRRLVVRDERGITASWTIEPVDATRLRLAYTIEGPIPAEKAQSVQYDSDVKFQALQTILEERGRRPPATGQN